MAVDGVSNNTYQAYTPPVSQNTNSKTNTTATEQTKTNAQGNEAAVYEKSNDTKTKNYKPDQKKVNEMMAESQKKVEDFKSLVQSIFKKQGMTVQDILKKMQNGESVELKISEEDRKAAEESIGEDGYYGVNKTTERIIDFAKALTGGDPKKVAEMRDAFKKGYEAIKGLFDNKMPDVSEKTYEAVMKAFDEWENPTEAASTPAAEK